MKTYNSEFDLPRTGGFLETWPCTIELDDTEVRVIAKSKTIATITFDEYKAVPNNETDRINFIRDRITVHKFSTVNDHVYCELEKIARAN